MEEEYHEKSSENSNIDLRDFAGSGVEQNKEMYVEDDVLAGLGGKFQNASPVTENTQEET